MDGKSRLTEDQIIEAAREIRPPVSIGQSVCIRVPQPFNSPNYPYPTLAEAMTMMIDTQECVIITPELHRKIYG